MALRLQYCSVVKPFVENSIILAAPLGACFLDEAVPRVVVHFGSTAMSCYGAIVSGMVRVNPFESATNQSIGLHRN